MHLTVCSGHCGKADPACEDQVICTPLQPMIPVQANQSAPVWKSVSVIASDRGPSRSVHMHSLLRQWQCANARICVATCSVCSA